MTRSPTSSSLVLCAPPQEIQLAAATRNDAWAIARPGIWHGWIGGQITITPEILQEFADSYDPRIHDRAAINFDHSFGGPAHGWIERLFVENEMLWAVPVELSEEMREGISSGRWRRVSIEADGNYQPTGGWYLTGLAVLGAANPAVKGLPEIQLPAASAERPRAVAAAAPPRMLVQFSATPTGNGTTTPDTGEEESMSTPSNAPDSGGSPAGSPTPTQRTDPAPETTPTPAPEGTPEPSSQPGSNDPETVALTERRQIRDERLALREERLAARRERVEAQVDRDLDGLGSRVTPAMLRTGLREALVELRAAEQPTTVQLTARREDGSEATREAGVYDVLLAALRSAPEFEALGQGGLAGADDPDAPRATDTRTAEAKQLCMRHGIDDDEAARLRAKYPDSFRTDVN